MARAGLRVARYDLNLHKGSHDFKLGGEYTNARMWDDYHVLGRGQMTFTSLPLDIARRIPASEAMNPAAWDLTGLNPIAQRFNINYPKTDFEWVTPDPQFALWIGDTWRASNSLTINYGMRYTNYWGGATAPGITPNSIPITQYSTVNTPGTNIPYLAPGDFGYKVGVHDNLDFGPQGGFAWNVGGGNDLVIRGGTGLYYTVYEKANTKNQILTSNLFSAQFNNNGTNPNFVGNPTNGVDTYDEAILLKGIPQSGAMVNGELKMPMSWQSGLGSRSRSARAPACRRTWSTERRCANCRPLRRTSTTIPSRATTSTRRRACRTPTGARSATASPPATASTRRSRRRSPGASRTTSKAARPTR